MSTFAFDTLAYVKTLREAGIEQKYAEAQATALIAVLKDNANELATKRDIEQLRHDIEQLQSSLKHDAELFRAELKKDLAEAKADLTRWVVAVGILQTTLIVAILARLAKII